MKFGIREVLFIAVLVGVLGCAYFVIFQRANEHRQHLQADTESMRRKLAEMQVLTAGVQDMNRRIDELQKEIDYFHSRLPQHREVETILKQVTQLAEEHGLTTKTFRTYSGDTTPTYMEEPITMDLSGDFKPGFYSFLLQLEDLPRLTRVTHMNLTKINDHDGQMTAEVTLSIFFEPDAPAGATASAQ